MQSSRDRFSLRLFVLALSILAVKPICVGQGSTTFGAPVKVTPTGGFGYEPSFVADGFGNIFATAH